VVEWISAGFDALTFAGLLIVSFAGSFITASMGIGGGVLLLAVMASLLPPAALIPVHGVVQIGSNLLRMIVMIRHIYWAPFGGFFVGTILGVTIGGAVSVSLPPALVQVGVGLFILYNVVAHPPAWLSRLPLVTGVLSSFLTMFFGATGPFVATFVMAFSLSRERHVASQAALMALQHGAKIFTFALLGFQFAPWVGFATAMIFAGFLGTLIGRLVLMRMSDHNFQRALNLVLIILSARLIYSGYMAGW
jgi:uncharacterized membrane protein YfcA